MLCVNYQYPIRYHDIVALLLPTLVADQYHERNVFSVTSSDIVVWVFVRQKPVMVRPVIGLATTAKRAFIRRQAQKYASISRARRTTPVNAMAVVVWREIT
jgi:hypothetical protein